MRRFHSLALCAALLAGCATTRSSQAGNVARVRLAVATERVEQRDWASALRALEPLPEDKDNRAAALTLRGTVFREQGLLDEAETDLKEALAMKDDLAPAHASIAILYDLKGNPALAEEHHRKAVDKQPENPRFLNDFAYSLYTRGDAKGAIPLYQRALRAAPDDHRIRNNLGFALARAGDFRRAAQHFVLGGTLAEAHNNLGYAYEQAGNLAQAFEQYTAAARLDSRLERARNNLRHLAAQLDRPIPPDLAERRTER